MGRQFAWTYGRVALEHPYVFPLIALRPLRPQVFRPVEVSNEVLQGAGFDRRHALAVFQKLANYSSDFALEEIAISGGESSLAMATLDAAEFPPRLLHRPMKRDAAFERGLDIILAGLRVQSTSSGRPARDFASRGAGAGKAATTA